jgi:hypothetical protein
MSAAEQAHAIVLALNDQAIAVVFDFLEPNRGRRDGLTRGRETRLKRSTHAAEIGNLAEKCESGRSHNGPERQPVELGYHLHVACLDGDYFCSMIQTPFHLSAGGSA